MDAFTCRTIKSYPYFTVYAKVNPTWIKDIKVVPETVKLLKVNLGKWS